MFPHCQGEMASVFPRRAEFDHVTACDHGVPLPRYAEAIGALEVPTKALTWDGVNATSDASARATVAGAEYEHVAGDLIMDQQRRRLQAGNKCCATHFDN